MNAYLVFDEILNKLAVLNFFLQVVEKLNSAGKRIQTRFEGFKDFDPSNEYHLMNAASVVEEELCFAKDGILTGIAGLERILIYFSFEHIHHRYIPFIHYRIPIPCLAGLTKT